MNARMGEECSQNPTEYLALHCFHVVGFDTPEKHFVCCWCGATHAPIEPKVERHGAHSPEQIGA